MAEGYEQSVAMMRTKSLQEQIDRKYVSDPKEFLRGEVYTFTLTEKRHRNQIIDQVKKDYVALPRECDYARIHLGVGGFYNLDVATTGRHDGLILCDVNYDQIRFWKKIIELLEKCETPEQFRKAFAAHYEKVTYPQQRPDHYMHVGDNGRVGLRFRSTRLIFSFTANTFLRDSEWLKHPEMYRHLHEMAKAGNIATVPLDIFNEQQCHELSEAIRTSSINGKPAKLDTVYASVVYDRAMPQTSYEHLLGDLRDFVNLAKEMQMENIEVRDPSVVRGSKVFNELRDGFEAKIMRTGYAPRDGIGKGELVQYLDILTEVFLEMYRYCGKKDLQDIKSGRVLGASCEETYGRNNHADMANWLMNRLLSHPDMEPSDIEYLGKYYSSTTTQWYEYQRKEPNPTYAAISALSTDDSTKIYCTSAQHRELVRLSGRDSTPEIREWREKMRAEGQAFASCNQNDVILGR